MTDVAVRAINDALSSENGGLFVNLPGEELPAYLLPKVWDERECVRIVKLALVYPSLLGAAERRAWELVRREDEYWAQSKSRASTTGKTARRLEDLKVEVLEAEWDQLLRAATAKDGAVGP